MGSLGIDHNGYERVIVEETELKSLRARYRELQVNMLNCPSKGLCMACCERQRDFVSLIAAALYLRDV